MTFSQIKWFKLGLCGTKHATQHDLVYIIVLKWLQLQTIVICLKLRVKLRFWGFLSVFGTFSHKVVQTWFVSHETWHTTLFHIYYCVEMVGMKTNSHMLELHAKLRFWGFIDVFGTFSHKVVSIWFICHETWHTTLFANFHYFEILRIENNSDMFEITC